MERLMGLIGATVGGWLGYAIGAPLNVFLGLALSVIGTGAGMYFAVRLVSY